jgi:hypothetical protein
MSSRNMSLLPRATLHSDSEHYRMCAISVYLLDVCPICSLLQALYLLTW